MRGKSAKALAQQGFPYIRCWPRHRRKHRMRKLKKVAFSHFFDTLQAPKGALSKVDAHIGTLGVCGVVSYHDEQSVLGAAAY